MIKYKKKAEGVLKMQSFLMEKLSEITEEEKRLLAGGGVEKRIYTADRDFVIDALRLTRGREVAARTHTRFTSFPMHRHNYAETMFVLSGEITHVLDGERLTLRAGDILFMNKHVTHAVERAEREDIGVNLILSDAFLSGLAERLSATGFSAFIEENARPSGAAAYLCFHTEGAVQIGNLVENMLYEITEYEPNPHILAETVALLLSYLSLKEEKLLFFRNAAQTREEKRREAVLAYLRDHYRGGTLEDLSRRLGLSQPYLSAWIGEHLGMSMKALLVRERQERARLLLRESDLPIAEVIRTVGYESPSYFHREFLKQFGMTPRAYRMKEKEKSGEKMI